ncbi:MAG TPA: hypothetical protein DCS93_17195 [Microscillaceae bacterium]|nr:hypothetical protein [Microscillaceae bacterium]
MLISKTVQMKQSTLLLIICTLCLLSCQQEKITIGTNVSETVYLDNNGASMRMLIEGNTSSRTFLLFIHGGPGTSAFFYNTDYLSQHLENRYALVYWDHRNSGASQGNTNQKYLNLPQMTEDLKKVIQVIRHRYGNHSRVFIVGHSFGGLLASSFMTTKDYQKMVNGWIVAGGSHNYPLNNILTRDMLQEIGEKEYQKKRHTSKWKEIIDYCQHLPDHMTLEQANQLNTYATDAENLIDGITNFDVMTFIKKYGIKDKWPITSIFLNHSYSQGASFNHDLAKTEFSSQLPKITTPTLLIFGKYDFICPPGLGQDIYHLVNTMSKKLVISEVSGHSVMFQDESLFCEEVSAFIDTYQ